MAAKARKIGVALVMAGIITLVTSVAVALIAPAPAPYEVIEVPSGGVIAGTVTLDGPPPEPKGFNLVTFPDPEYCGRISDGNGWRLLRDFTVDPSSGGLKDVLVMLEDIEAGKPFEVSIPRVEARDCQFLPFVTVVRDGHGVEVVNMDPVMHDVQAYETSHELGARVLFNSPLPMNHYHKRGDIHAHHRHLPGASMLERIRLSKSRQIFLMQCGFHAFMESWAFAVNNPYYAITDRAGSFTITNVPPGTYRLVAWHPQSGTAPAQRVVVEPNQRLTTTVSLPAPQGRRSAYQVVKNPRFGMGILGRPVEIIPLVEQQH